MKRALLWAAALIPLVILGVSRPSLDRGAELSSGEFDSNSDCVVRGDEFTFHTPSNVIGGLSGGHGRGFESVQFNQRAYRVIFSPNSDEVELVQVRDCGVHVRGGEEFSVDANSVDTAIVSRRGRAVVDRIPDRGFGPVREMVVHVSWEGNYRIGLSDAGLDAFDLAVPLFGAQSLVVRGLEGKGQDMTYEVYDYANARHFRFRIPQSALPERMENVVRVKALR
jgi:hypothetical protein